MSLFICTFIKPVLKESQLWGLWSSCISVCFCEHSTSPHDCCTCGPLRDPEQPKPVINTLLYWRHDPLFSGDTSTLEDGGRETWIFPYSHWPRAIVCFHHSSHKVRTVWFSLNTHCKVSLLLNESLLTHIQYYQAPLSTIRIYFSPTDFSPI